MLKRLGMAALLIFAMPALASSPLAEMRMTPAEIRAGSFGGTQVGSSGVVGIHTKVLFGDPATAGFFTILLFVPPNTTIQAHSHRDDRTAVVVSGEWQFGYGKQFDEKLLKQLPQGSVYSEPASENHFARTGKDAVVVEISGYGPSDTRYFDPANDPAQQHTK
jgi:quercetin dioxygenase-like cupin family protein